MRKKLGEILLASGAVTQADIDLALMDQAAGDASRLGDQLVSLGKISPLQLAKALAHQHTVPLVELPRIPPEVLEAVPLEFQLRHRLVPFRVSADAVSVGMVDPADEHAIDELKTMLGKKIVRYVVPSDAIDAAHAPTVELPEVAPHVAPVGGRQSPPPTEHDLFGAAPEAGLSDELFSGLDLPVPTTADIAPPPPVAPIASSSSSISRIEEEPEFFESTPVVPHAAVPPPPAIAPSPVPAPPAIFELEPELPLTTPASEGLTSSPSGSFAVEVSESQAESFEVSLGSGDFGPAPAAEPLPEPPPVPPSADDFFAATPTAREPDFPVNLEEPEPAATVRVAPAPVDDLPFPLDEPVAEVPAPLAPPKPAKESMPSWLGSEASSAPPSVGWTGALDDTPPSRLITAAVRALVEKGLLTEAELLAALKKNG